MAIIDDLRPVIFGLQLLGVNIPDVGAELFDILFMGIAYHSPFFASLAGIARSAFHKHRVLGGRECLIGFLVDVKIAELDSRNSVFACATWDSKIFDGLRAAHTRSACLKVIRHFRVIGFKSFRPVYSRCLEQFHVARTADIQFDGNSVVIFNKGQNDETKAPIIVSGNTTTFGQTTDDAMKDALRGETRIFADGIKTATKANQLNQNELARWEAMKKLCESYCDSLRSAIASNKKKAEDYKEAISKYKPNIDFTGNGETSVTVTVPTDE